MAYYFESDEARNYPQILPLKRHLIGHPGIIAGGCFKSIFLGEALHDVDMFFRTPEDFHKTVAYFRKCKDEYAPGYENKNVVSFIHLKSGLRVECIRKIFGTPEEILDQFDFTITKFAYEIEAEPTGEPDDWKYVDAILYHEFFFEHLVMRRLVVDEAMPYPVATFNRTYKYAKSGFFPCRETKLKILKAIQGEEIKDASLGAAMYEGHD